MNTLFENTKKPFIWMQMNELRPSAIRGEINEKLKQDILTNGVLYPLTLEEGTTRIVLGNQRYDILKSLNVTEVPVIFIKTEKLVDEH